MLNYKSTVNAVLFEGLLRKKLERIDIVAGFQVMLNENQTQELQKHIFDLTNEAVKRALKDVGTDKDFLNQKEMSDWIGVSVNTLKTYVKEGLPIIVMGGRNFYSKKEVSRFLLSKQKGGANA